jgi:hypothetical protein
MADNTTTYKAVIETEVKGQKSVDDLNKSLDSGDEKFVSLRRQIRETTIALQEMADKGQTGTKEFKELSNKLDDLGDAQKRVAFQSGQIEDKLAALPGPIGNIGKGFQSAKDAVDTFGTGLAVATGGLVLIVSAILAMKDAMGKTKEGQEALNKVSQAFSKVLAPIFAILEKVGIPLFEKFAQAVEYIAGKIAKFASYLGISESKVKEVYASIDEVSKKAAEDEKKRQEELTKKNKEEQDKRKAAHEKYLKDKEEREKEAAEEEKRNLQYQLEQYEKHLKARAKLDASYISGDSLKSKVAEAKKAEDEEIKRAKDTAETIRLLKINSEDKQLAWSKTHQTTALADEITAKQKSAKKEVTIIDWLNSEKKKKLDENLMAVKAGLNIAGNLVDQGSNAAKAIAVAQTGIDTYQSATAAYKAVVGIPVAGPFLAPIAAAAAIAAGLISVNKIISTPIPKMGDGSGGSSDASAASITPPSAPSLPSMQFSDSSFNVGGNNPTSQIASTLAQTTKQPIKAYVVSTDMSSQQALDRRTNIAATF